MLLQPEDLLYLPCIVFVQLIKNLPPVRMMELCESGTSCDAKKKEFYEVCLNTTFLRMSGRRGGCETYPCCYLESISSIIVKLKITVQRA